MPSPRRRPKTYISDLSEESLDAMTGGELIALERARIISPATARAVEHRHTLARHGGIDPYADLKLIGED